VWAVLAASNPDLPSPSEAWRTWWTLLRAPFSRTAESNLGIGWQLAGSLRRVGTGFLLAAAVGIPLGLLLGGSRRAWAAMNPVVQLLRPVSPLAWFPICLVVLRDAPRAAIWVIFITALWPIVLNTAAGARSVPADQLHVARVFRFGRVSFVRHILLPNTIPSLITGLRLAMGTAWMVIVAVEMLAGGTGIGFFVWDSYNALDLSRVVCAIVLIGLVGLCIDALFLRLARRFEPGEAHR
jgi:nitrate/nitrite transport system permease protein